MYCLSLCMVYHLYKTFENVSARNALEEKQLKIPFVDVDCSIMDELLYLNPNFEKYVDSIVNGCQILAWKP